MLSFVRQMIKAAMYNAHEYSPGIYHSCASPQQLIISSPCTNHSEGVESARLIYGA